MENTTINELNGLLKGEQMAVDAYERFIKSVNDCSVKEDLQKIRTEHKSHINSIAERIEELGGKPENNTGFAGFMAAAKATMQSISEEKSTIEILKQAYDGEYKGIAMAEELVKGDLDDDSANLVQKILSNDQGHLKKMKGIIEEFDGVH